MVQVVVLADDMTGAADTAVAFVNAGLSAAVMMGTAAGLTLAVDVVALDLETRDADASTSSRVASLAARSVVVGSAVHLYKKVDSTLRGHIGLEVQETASTLADTTSKTILSLVAVAFPDLGRRVRNGRVLIGQADHAARVTRGGSTSALSVSSTLAASSLRTEAIRLEEVRLGPDHVANLLLRFVEAEVDAVVLDAETRDDLRVIALAGTAVGRLNSDVKILWVGSGGLARELPEAWGLVQDDTVVERDLPVMAGRIAAVVGSGSPLARAQHRALVAQPGVSAVEVDPAELRHDRHPPLQQAWNRLNKGLLVGDISLSLAPPRSGVVELQEFAANGLAELIASSTHQLAALITTGGTTTAAVLRGFGFSGVRVVCELEPGVVASIPLGEPTMLLVSKAGGFGDVNTLTRCRSRIAAAQVSLGRGPT